MQVWKGLCFSALWRRRWIFLFLILRKFSKPKCSGGEGQIHWNKMQEAITAVCNISLFYSSHWSFQSRFDPLVPFILKWFLCNHSTLSRNFNRYFPQWSCITTACLLFPVSEGALSHLFKILLYENLIFFFCSLGSPRAAHPSSSRWSELQVKKEHAGWIQLQEEPRSHLHATRAGLHAWQGAILNQQDQVVSIRLQPLAQ